MFEDYLEAAYAEAEEATRGAMLNARGRRAGVSVRSLFMGPERRAQAYASPELREFWYYHPRVTVTEFVSQIVNLRVER